MPSPKEQLQELIENIVAARREYYRLRFDEPSPDKLGKPASEKEIVSLERKLGWALPPSYRAFLELHNGWENFDGDGKLLSIDDQGSKWVKDRIGDFVELFDEHDDTENPFAFGAIPIMMGKHINHFVALDPRKPKPKGEMQFLSYDYANKERAFKDFAAYLTHKLSITRKLVERQKVGTDED